MASLVYKKISTTSEKSSLIDIIYPLLEITYKNTLGVGISSSNLVTTDGVYSVALVNEQIVAGIIYKNSHGNKIRLVFHSGTVGSKKIMMKILINDLKSNNVWVECSGLMEKLMNSIKAPYVNSEISKLLFLTSIAKLPDGIHYNREVRPNIFKVECCMGNPLI